MMMYLQNRLEELDEAKNTTYLQLIKAVPKSLQLFLNVCLVLLALILCFLLFKELIEFLKILLFAKEDGDYKLFLANILIFFIFRIHHNDH